MWGWQLCHSNHIVALNIGFVRNTGGTGRGACEWTYLGLSCPETVDSQLGQCHMPCRARWEDPRAVGMETRCLGSRSRLCVHS